MEEKTFAEQIVTRKAGAKEWALKIAIGVLTAALIAVLAVFPNLMGMMPIFAAVILILAIALLRFLHQEFEYTVAESELSVDSIRGRSARKPLFTVDVKNFDLFMPYDEAEVARLRGNVQRVYDVCESPSAEGRWCAVYSAGGEDGRTLLLLQPNERVLGVLLRYVPSRSVKR